MSKHYVVVLAPQRGGRWRAHFPDFPGCRAECDSVEGAVARASIAVAELIAGMRRAGECIPAPQPYEVVRTDDAWARERGIEWSSAVISLVPVKDSG